MHSTRQKSRIAAIAVSPACPRCTVANAALGCFLFASAAVLPAQTMVSPPQAPAQRTVAHASGDSAQSLLNLVLTTSRDAIATARIVAANGASPDVKAYAIKVITDHDSTMRAWIVKAPGLSLTIPDSAPPASTAAVMKTDAAKDGVSEVRDSTTVKRGGFNASVIHNASVATRVELQKLNGSALDAKYLAAERESAEAVLKQLAEFPSVHKDLQTLLTNYRNLIEDQRSKSRKLMGGAPL